jgi:hypothetical protein
MAKGVFDPFLLLSYRLLVLATNWKYVQGAISYYVQLGMGIRKITPANYEETQKAISDLSQR